MYIYIYIVLAGSTMARYVWICVARLDPWLRPGPKCVRVGGYFDSFESANQFARDYGLGPGPWNPRYGDLISIDPVRTIAFR